MKLITEEYYRNNKGFIVSLVKQLNGGYFDDDLFQAGSMGLIKASKKYDGSKNIKFLTYASYWIEREIRDEIKKRNKTRNNIELNPELQYGKSESAEDIADKKESWNNFKAMLNDEEKKIVSLKLKGLSQIEIGKIIGAPQATVSKLLKNIRKVWGYTMCEV